MKSQSQVLSDTADIEDDVTSFDNQRLKDSEVCRSYLPKATNFLNVSKLSSPCLMPYGEPCTAGNAGSLSSDDRVRDESILHSSSMLCNGYPEKLISGSSNGLLHDERNRQSIGRLVGDAVNTGCDVAIDKGESNIISNILSIDFDPGDDSLTSPHNIAKLLTDNTDSQPGPLKKNLVLGKFKTITSQGSLLQDRKNLKFKLWMCILLMLLASNSPRATHSIRIWQKETFIWKSWALQMAFLLVTLRKLKI